ncbi:MAG: amino-acid N-acetyltransferase [Propionibacteriaceae bacterium]|nr:amino-acid N-acetyltransferase [Propionibacteriaceae bacterium]
MSEVRIRPAVAADVSVIREITRPYVEQHILVAKPPVAYYEGLQQFQVAEYDGQVVGCGALHVFWEDLGEIRTLAVAEQARGLGIGSALVDQLIASGRQLGLSRLFCLTFEVNFFSQHGFSPLYGNPVSPTVFAEMLRSYDEGVAEFLELDRVKPNTLGNIRMLLSLSAS